MEERAEAEAGARAADGGDEEVGAAVAVVAVAEVADDLGKHRSCLEHSIATSYLSCLLSLVLPICNTGLVRDAGTQDATVTSEKAGPDLEARADPRAEVETDAMAHTSAVRARRRARVRVRARVVAHTEVTTNIQRAEADRGRGRDQAPSPNSSNNSKVTIMMTKAMPLVQASRTKLMRMARLNSCRMLASLSDPMD